MDRQQLQPALPAVPNPPTPTPFPHPLFPQPQHSPPFTPIITSYYDGGSGTQPATLNGNPLPDDAVAFSGGNSIVSAPYGPIQSSASVDALIEQIQSLARSIHGLSQSVGLHVNEVGTRGAVTVDHFDANFGSIGTDVERISATANAKMSASFPPWLLTALACAFGIFLVLGVVWLIGAIVKRALKWKQAERGGIDSKGTEQVVRRIEEI